MLPDSGRDWQNRATGRVLVALLILSVEYALVAVLYDGGDLRSRSGFVSGFANLGEVVTAALVVLTAGVLLNRRVLLESLAHVAATLPKPSGAWGGLHVVGYALALGFAALLFRVDVGPGGVIALIAGGVLSVAFSVGAIGVSLLGSGARSLFTALLRVAISGIALGLLAWFAGLSTRPLWPWLAEGTLVLSASLLSAFVDDVSFDGAEKTLGTPSFEVIVDTACSGIEGMGLVAVFLLGYLLRFRREIVVWRAVALLPIGVGLAFLANSVRIAALVALGSFVSPEIAFGGFHSKAGWAMFCAIALSLVFLLHRSELFMRAPQATSGDNPTSGYCVPLLVFLAVGLFSGMFAAGVDLFYAARVVAALAALYLLRRYYVGIDRSFSFLSVAVGLGVFAVWFAFSPRDPLAAEGLRQRLDGLSGVARAAWIASRVVGGVLIVPIVEELSFRGFLQRRLVDSDFSALPYQKTTMFAVAGSALAFGGLHQAWLLGTFAGAAYSLLTMRSGRLVDAIAAHATTNLAIAVTVLAFGRWELWT